jgi:SLT domain-containing protein
MEVNICRSLHKDSFVDASTYMATAVSRIFPAAQPGSSKYKSRRNINSMGRGGRGRGRGGRGRGGRGRGRGRGRGGGHGRPSGQTENGVDISDPCRYFTDDEFAKLSNETKDYIRNHPDRPAAIAARKKRKPNISAVDSANNEAEKRTSKAIINGVMNAMRQNEATVQFPTNGSRAAASSASRRQNTPAQVSTEGGDDMSRVTYDHLGNIV